ncbi:MAG: 16S rRNA (adenine(1518)-N(6)/adenine(1519)-N(6))-dimethyltransferase RsmA [Bacillota bacterium]|nr:16S rRNA (adenine(1518)-N(6)/adenine(1519)-N(6))-dimethyltransferase RsmA [Bacillota bacterium]
MDRLTSPGKIRNIMKKHNVRFSKSLGQNFIVNDSIIEEIISKSNITKNDCVLEIGPGIGVLTQALAENADKVLAVELDNKLIPVLEETLSDYENVDIIHNDILKVDINEEIKNRFDKPVKVIANLPYYITTPIIMKLLEERIDVKEIIVMVQKEVAERMVSKSGVKAYGSLSVAVQYYSEASIIIDVNRDNFLPPPNVDSSVIKLKIRDNPAVKVLDDEYFFEVVKGAFALRRKTLINSLSKSKIAVNKEIVEKALIKLGLDLRIRGEKLSIEQFAKLSNELYKARN